MTRPRGLGARIRNLRYRRGLSQAQLAARAGVGEKTLKRLEAGRTGMPHPDTLKAIAGALGLDPEALFQDEAAEPAEVVLPPAVHQLPRPPSNFTGRTAELAELDARFAEGKAIYALQGMGGIGKTALSLVIAERWSERFPDGQFYLDLKGAAEPVSPAEAMLHVIRSIEPSRPLPKTEAEVASAYRSILRGKRVLLLLDNAAGRDQVEPLVPPEGSVLLVTSRQRFALPGQHAIALAPLPPSDSQALLGTLAPHAAQSAGALAELCGGLPLALSLAGRALAERPDLDPGEYAARLADDSNRLRQLDLTESDGGVEASFALSYELLDREQQAGLCALAVFPQHFDRAAAAAVWELSEEAADARIGALLRFHLLEWDGAGRDARYRLHDLVRLFALARLEPEAREGAALRHARHYLELLARAERVAQTSGTERGLSIVDREWPHIRAAFEHCRDRASSSKEAARLASRAPDASLLRLRQNPHERVAYCELGIELARAEGERALPGRLLAHAARAHQELGDARSALEQARRSLSVASAASDVETQITALVAQGDAYHALGEPRQAIAAAERALALARETNRRGDESAAAIVLAWAHHVAGESARAVEYAAAALPIARAMRAPDLEAMARLALGYAREALGQHARVAEHVEACLRIARELGDLRIEGYTMLLARERGQRERNIERAVEIAREIGDRRLLGNALLYTSHFHNVRGAPCRAREAAEGALEIAEQTGDRALTGNALVALGSAQSALQELSHAVETLQRAIEVAVAIGTPRLEAIAAWLLGSALERQGRIEEAIALLERAYAYQQSVGHHGAAQTRSRIEALRARSAGEG